MKNFLEEFDDGSVKNQKKRKFTVMLIFITVIVILCALAVLLGSFVVAAIKDKQFEKELENNSEGSGDAGYTTITVEAEGIHSGDLLLVNKNTAYVFDSNNEAMVSFPTSTSESKRVYSLKDSKLTVNPTALTAFDLMMKDLYNSTISKVENPNIVVWTAYRSSEDQEALNGSIPAGHSDFHTGMLIELKDNTDGVYDDINSKALNGKYDWLYKNAHKYGFVVRYPDDIPEDATGKNAGKNYSSITGVEDCANMFRYVGVAHATYMYNNALCLEEYLELLRTAHTSETPLTVKGADGKSYEVYYCASAGDTTDISVPSKYEYEISGDNLNGYIVTVCKSRTIKK